MRFFIQLFLLLVCCTVSAQADVTTEFQTLLTHLQTIQGEFTQTVVTRAGKTNVSSGSFAIQRPNKFRWHYTKPLEQLIVNDGKDIWLFDPDLNQVTVKPMDKAMDASPAALLSGDNQIAKRYTLKAQPPHDGLAWIEATPKQGDSNFNRVRLGFVSNDIHKMELEDSFGQTTHIDLKLQDTNSKPNPNLFRFTPPKGADVVHQ